MYIAYLTFLPDACVQPGVSWEVGFTNGLVNSRIFLPIISKAGINSQSEARCDWTKLTSKSKVRI
jgi:hypothetical protein